VLSMNVNSTLIIQIFNFVVAYLLLRMIILQPLLEKIFFQRNEDLKMLDIINQEKASITDLEIIQKEEWQRFQEYCKKTIIPLKTIANTEKINEKMYPTDSNAIDPIDIEKIAMKYSSLINQWLKENS